MYALDIATQSAGMRTQKLTPHILASVPRCGETKRRCTVIQMDSLQDLCRKARHDKGMTNADIAEQSGVPISTVSNFFTAGSKAPSVYTAGPICAVLGVSINQFFGINPQDEPVSDSERKLLLQQIAFGDERCAMLERSIATKKRIILALFILALVVLVYGVTLDVLCGSIGFIRR